MALLDFAPQFNRRAVSVPRTKSSLKQDLAILQREAKAINADFSYWPSKASIYITINAPLGFVWKAINNSTIETEVDSTLIAEATRDLLDQMSHGFTQIVESDEEDQDSTTYEDEPTELDFDC